MAAEKDLVLDEAGSSIKLKSEGQEIISLYLNTSFDLRKGSLEPYFNVGLFYFLAPIFIAEANRFILGGGVEAPSPGRSSGVRTTEISNHEHRLSSAPTSTV
jgi:hypothetical protein